MVSREYPRRGRGGARLREMPTSQQRRRRDPSLHGISTSRPRRRRDSLTRGTLGVIGKASDLSRRDLIATRAISTKPRSVSNTQTRDEPFILCKESHGLEQSPLSHRRHPLRAVCHGNAGVSHGRVAATSRRRDWSRRERRSNAGTVDRRARSTPLTSYRSCRITPSSTRRRSTRTSTVRPGSTLL